jgi:hypothetical protein
MIEIMQKDFSNVEKYQQPGYYFMNSLQLINQLKNQFTKMNFNSEGQLWFNVVEFKEKYEIKESDYIGKPPKFYFNSSELPLESEEG